ncbi:OadG family transporter subunit [Sphaerochaeta sp. S2]|uniref:OadG family transporter subunit n=1 Tax=Sphaerochaeta sp. S2 TaxID=2798868 RepID=UPI0018EA1163|nr:OadG family transporter subunit [Sphaerochaeta sp. S2]MBJ2354852.1 OadG family protein [Sphaerochaeta sp. S2]
MVFLAQLPKEQLVAQLENGVILMILGIATVFVFLTLLFFLTKAMSAIARKIAPQKPKAVVSSPAAVTASASSASEADIAAAIVAAFAKSKE